jgi:hypothetical protein
VTRDAVARGGNIVVGLARDPIVIACAALLDQAGRDPHSVDRERFQTLVPFGKAQSSMLDVSICATTGNRSGVTASAP